MDGVVRLQEVPMSMQPANTVDKLFAASGKLQQEEQQAAHL